MKEQNNVSDWRQEDAQYKHLSKTSYSEISDEHRQMDGNMVRELEHFFKVAVLSTSIRKEAQLHSDQDKNWYYYTSLRVAKIKGVTKCGVEKLELWWTAGENGNLYKHSESI